VHVKLKLKDVLIMEKNLIHKKFAPKSTAGLIRHRTGVNINSCWHCKTCTSGCSFSEDMDYHPNQILRMLQLGMKKEVLESNAIWICVACNTCSMGCPQGIDMAAVMECLRTSALEEGAEIASPEVAEFHKEVAKSVVKYGRTHKLEVMLKYKVKKRDFFSDIKVGIKMFQKGKLEILPPEKQKFLELLTLSKS
jgi:heterodisulfide reductase subunit C